MAQTGFDSKAQSSGGGVLADHHSLSKRLLHAEDLYDCQGLFPLAPPPSLGPPYFPLWKPKLYSRCVPPFDINRLDVVVSLGSLPRLPSVYDAGLLKEALTKHLTPPSGGEHDNDMVENLGDAWCNALFKTVMNERYGWLPASVLTGMTVIFASNGCFANLAMAYVLFEQLEGLREPERTAPKVKLLGDTFEAYIGAVVKEELRHPHWRRLLDFGPRLFSSDVFPHLELHLEHLCLSVKHPIKLSQCPPLITSSKYVYNSPSRTRMRENIPRHEVWVSMEQHRPRSDWRSFGNPGKVGQTVEERLETDTLLGVSLAADGSRVQRSIDTTLYNSSVWTGCGHRTATGLHDDPVVSNVGPSSPQLIAKLPAIAPIKSTTIAAIETLLSSPKQTKPHPVHQQGKQRSLSNAACQSKKVAPSLSAQKIPTLAKAPKPASPAKQKPKAVQATEGPTRAKTSAKPKKTDSKASTVSPPGKTEPASSSSVKHPAMQTKGRQKKKRRRST